MSAGNRKPAAPPLTVRELSRGEAKRTRSLWESCFPEDSPGFLDYYYSEKTKDNRILAGELRGQIVSMLHRNPYRVMVKGHELTLDYIVAVGTQKEYRGNGYMRQVLTAALRDMYREGRAFTYLMPAAEAIYTPYDFRFVGDVWQTRLREDFAGRLIAVPVEDFAGRLAAVTMEAYVDDGGAGGTEKAASMAAAALPAGSGNRGMAAAELAGGAGTADAAADPAEDANGAAVLAAAAGLMERWLRQFDVYARRDEAYVRRLCQELKSENGCLEMLLDGENPVGLRAIWGIDQKEQRLLYAQEPFLAVDGREARIMARITNVQAFLPLFSLAAADGDAHTPEEETLLLIIEDPWIPENSGSFLWTLRADGSEVSPERGKTALLSAAGVFMPVPKLSVTISELALWLFGREAPEQLWPGASPEALRLLARVDVIRGVYLDEIV